MEQYYGYKIEVDEKELDDIFCEIEKARRTISSAYNKLGELGVIKFKRATIESGPDDN